MTYWIIEHRITNDFAFIRIAAWEASNLRRSGAGMMLK